ncbi:hypothetical protein GGX14DRAFT_471303, partial [Mycena pura]
IVIGASVAGLAAAIALKSSGHNVVVLEKDSELGGTRTGPNGCARVPPNGSKILLDWDLEAAARAKATLMPGFWVNKYGPEETPGSNTLGLHRLSEELLFETQARGDYMIFRHQSLLRILYDKLQAQSSSKAKGKTNYGPHVSVLFKAEVVDVDCASCEVTLQSGEVYKGDAIIGADGAFGIVRQILMDEEDAEPDSATGLALYSANVPKALVVQNGLADIFYDAIGTSIWMGSNRAAMVVPAGEAEDLTLWVYTPDSSQDGTWINEAEMPITDVLGPCDARIRKLAGLAGPATCVQIKKPYELESWVSASGRVLALGQAAHPSTPGAFHCYSASLEDGAFIGRIFSHTRDRARVPEFFNAFQEHREPRCARINAADEMYVQVMTIPDGEMQARRDTGMRANHAEGRSVMDGDLQDVHDDFSFVFGYDAMDDADEWWINWGRFRDASATSNGQDALVNVFNFASVSESVVGYT